MALKITRIPERYRPGFAKIKGLPIDSVSAIAAALEQIAATGGLKGMTSVVEGAAKVSAREAEDIVTSLHSLYVLKASAEEPITEVVAVLIGAMETTGSTLATSESERPELASKLTRLLSLKSLERVSKVEQLKSDHQSIFYDAKILTDLRPVFDQPGEPPAGAIIGHTLRIVCHEYGEHRELYFALDAEGVKTLHGVAERAAEKAASLKAFLRSANLPDFS